MWTSWAYLKFYLTIINSFLSIPVCFTLNNRCVFINSKYADVDRSRSNVNCSGVTHIVSILLPALVNVWCRLVDSSAMFFLSHFRISIAKCLIVVAEEVQCHCRVRHSYTIYMGARILHTMQYCNVTNYFEMTVISNK